MQLLVALNDEEKAKGQLFWDDGESIGRLDYTHSRIFQLIS